MISRLTYFTLAVLLLLIFKVCGIIGISKIEFFKVSGIEMVTQNQKKKEKKKENEKLKNHSKPPKLVRKSLSSNSNKPKAFFFIENLFLSLPVTRSAGHNTILPSNISISKMLKVGIVFTGHFFKEFLISFLIISRLIYFGLLVL